MPRSTDKYGTSENCAERIKAKPLQSHIPFNSKKQKRKNMCSFTNGTCANNDLQPPQSAETDLLSSGDRSSDPRHPSATPERISPPEVKYNHKNKLGVIDVNSSSGLTSLSDLAATSPLSSATGSTKAEGKTKPPGRDTNKNCCTPEIKARYRTRRKIMGRVDNGIRVERHGSMKRPKGTSGPKVAPSPKAVSLQANLPAACSRFQSCPDMYTPWSLVDFRGTAIETRVAGESASTMDRQSFGADGALHDKSASLVTDTHLRYVPIEVDEEAVGWKLIPTDCAPCDQADENAETKDRKVSSMANISQRPKKYNKVEKGKIRKKSKKCITVERDDYTRRQEKELEEMSSLNTYAIHKDCSFHSDSSPSEKLDSAVDKMPRYRPIRNQFGSSSDHDFILNFMTRRHRSSMLKQSLSSEIPDNSADNSTRANPRGIARRKDRFSPFYNKWTLDNTDTSAPEERQTNNDILFLHDTATNTMEYHPKAAVKLCSQEITFQLCGSSVLAPCCAARPGTLKRACEKVSCADNAGEFCISSDVLSSTNCTSSRGLLSNKSLTDDISCLIQKSDLCSRIYQERPTSDVAQDQFSHDYYFEKSQLSLTTSCEIEGQLRHAEGNVDEGQLSWANSNTEDGNFSRAKSYGEEAQPTQHDSKRESQFSGAKCNIGKMNLEEDQFSEVKSGREADQLGLALSCVEHGHFKQAEVPTKVVKSNAEDHGSVAQDGTFSQAKSNNEYRNTVCDKDSLGKDNISQVSDTISQSEMKESGMVCQLEMKESGRVSQSEMKGPSQDSSVGCLSCAHGIQPGVILEICNCVESSYRSINSYMDEDSTLHETLEKEITTPKEACTNGLTLPQANSTHARAKPSANYTDVQTMTPFGTRRATPHVDNTIDKTTSQAANIVLNKQDPVSNCGQSNCTPSMSTLSFRSCTRSYCGLGEAKRFQKLALPNGYSPWLRMSGMLPKVGGVETPAAVCGDPEIQSFHDQLSSSLQTFQPKIWRPLTPDFVRRPTEPCHGSAGGRCRLRKVRPMTASSGHVTPRLIISRTGSAKYLPQRPDTPRVGQGDFDTLSPDVISEMILDTRPNTPTASYGATLRGRPHRNTSAREEFLDTDFGVYSDEDCRGDLSDNDSLSDLERGSEPPVDRNRSVPDIRMRPDDVYVPPSKKDMRRFDFDAENNVPPEYEFRCPIPGELHRINLRHCAVHRVDWRCSGFAANVCDPLAHGFMDRLVEMERQQFKTLNWEAKRVKRQRKKVPHSRRNASRQRDRHCCQLCLQPACVGDCPLKRVKPDVCDSCRQQLCSGECSETAYDQRMRLPREENSEALPSAPGTRACRTCQGRSNAKFINSSYTEAGRPTSAMLTFSRGQASAVVVRRPSSVDCVTSPANRSRPESKRPARQPKKPRGRNGLLPGKSVISNLTMSLTELSLIQY